jgi:hypothetical protein
LKSLYEEVAFLAYYLHWSFDEIITLDHRERQLWVTEVSRINQKLNDAAKEDNH